MKKEASFNQNVFNLSLALSQSRRNDAMELRCIILGPDGSIKESEVRKTRDDLAKQWGLDGRDLRNVDLVSEGIPHLLVRPSVILSACSLYGSLFAHMECFFSFSQLRTAM